jgi:hypothetical protein
MGFPPEPEVLIGPHRLNNAEAMTVRVAHMGHQVGEVQTPDQAQKCFDTVSKFKADIEADGLGDDANGKAIAAGYTHHAASVLRLLRAHFGPMTPTETP